MAIFRLQVLLVLDGVKMGAMIALNGHFLGNATDQFIRYVRHVPGSISSPVPAQNWPRRFDVSFGRLFFFSRLQVFEVGHLLQRRNGSAMNELNVTFGAELMISTDGRYVKSGTTSSVRSLTLSIGSTMYLYHNTCATQ